MYAIRRRSADRSACSRPHSSWISGARAGDEVDRLEEVLLGAPVGDVVQLRAVGAETERQVELLAIVRCEVAQRAAVDIEDVCTLVGGADHLDNRGAETVGVPGGGVELPSLLLEYQPVLALGNIQDVDRHVGRALLVAVEEHSDSVVGDRADLVLDVLAIGDRARPPQAIGGQDVELPLLRAQVVELEHDAARRPAVVPDGVLVA